MHDIGKVLTMLSLPAALAAQTTVTIRAGRLLDGMGGSQSNAIIVIDRGLISRVDGATPSGAVTYDLSRFTVLPGLIDGHAHLSWYFNRAGRLHTRQDGDTPVESMLAM